LVPSFELAEGVRRIVIVGEQRGLLLPGDCLLQWGMGTAGFRLVVMGEGSGVPALLSGVPRT